MSATDGELWSVTIRVLPRDTPAAIRVRRWLKYGLRQLGLKCVRLDEPAELVRLRQLVQALADRVAAQAELTCRAERHGPAMHQLAQDERSAPEAADGPAGAETTPGNATRAIVETQE